MELEDGKWKFDEKVVPIFDDHVKKSVPMYDEMHQLITDISAYFLEENTNVYDIGTSTGKVLKNLIQRYSKKVNYIGIDNSSDMINKLKNENLDINLLNIDVTDKFKFENASLITSILTLQFIKQYKRQNLIDSIYQGLNKGGAFILIEKVIGNNARFNEMYVELYHDLKLKNGLDEKHIFDKTRAIRGVMKPNTLDENIELLKNSGFKDIDVFFKWNNFSGIIAIK